MNRELLEALRPFAEYAEKMEKKWTCHDKSAFYGIKRPGAKQITYGDFWRVVKVYNEQTKLSVHGQKEPD